MIPDFLEGLRNAFGPTLFDYAVSPALKILVLLFAAIGLVVLFFRNRSVTA